MDQKPAQVIRRVGWARMPARVTRMDPDAGPGYSDEIQEGCEVLSQPLIRLTPARLTGPDGPGPGVRVVRVGLAETWQLEGAEALCAPCTGGAPSSTVTVSVTSAGPGARACVCKQGI